MFTYNDSKFKGRRKDLRKNSTPEEKILWARLRRKGLGVKFYRQYSVGPYILDFYCPLRRLAVELDGSQHLLNVEYDKQRDYYMNFHDIRVLRFWNSELSDNVDELVEKIIKELNSSPYVGGGQEGV